MNNRTFFHFLSPACCAAMAVCLPLRAEVRVPNVFSSHMVLQRESPIRIWGWASPGENVQVTLGSERAQTQADARGEWKAELPALPAGGPFTLTIRGSNQIEFEDVMLGEVWLCSGQSNMEMGMKMIRDAEKEIAAANYPAIRLLKVKRAWATEPQTNIMGAWAVCSPNSVAAEGWGGFSATAYFFGREIHRKLGVAVGLIDGSWGGTPIQSWTPPEGFARVPALSEDYAKVELADARSREHQDRLEKFLAETEAWLAAAREAAARQQPEPTMPAFPAELRPLKDVNQATALYNGMIHPLAPFSLRGAIWYQGESNSGEGHFYTERMKGLIGGWRQVWNEGDFPFYYVQIAPYNYGGDPEHIGEFWEAQADAQEIPNTGMAVINDIGDLKDIHPKNKQEVGRRLALWALAKTYGQNDVVYCGPTFKSLPVEAGQLRVSFDHAGGGLASRDGKPLSWFEVIDADEGGFVPANARIEGADVLLTAPDVPHPVAMRFAWSMLAQPNLMNAEGLPAGAFRAGTVPNRDALALKVPEAKDYQLVYDLDLNHLGHEIVYSADNHEKFHRPFDRIAYFLELQSGNDAAQYLYVSMDAFTSAAEKIGIPTVQSGIQFQQNVSNLNVWSNVKGIKTGTALAGGNIEFWSNNYGPANSAKVPNASDESYDFGDQPTEPVDGYGSMQVHNHDARQTLFALNHWREGQGADLGIGNAPSGNPDWTFAGNAKTYSSKRLRVLVRCK